MVMCKYAQEKSSIEHYYNERRTSGVLYEPEPSVGISNSKITVEGDILTCQFRRQKKNDSIPNYFDLNKEYYIQAAYGKYTPSSSKCAFYVI